MQNLTKRQREVFDWIAGFIREKGYCPSFEEIANGTNHNSLATIHKHVKNLCNKGWIVKLYRGYRSLQITPEAYRVMRKSNRYVHCPACQHEFRVGA